MITSRENFNRLFDHTLLKAPATHEQLEELCREAVQYGFGTVAVSSGNIGFCAEILRDSGVGITATVGFPLGNVTVESKLFEAEQAIRDGASDIDYVINIGRMKAGDTAYIKDEMSRIVELCRKMGAVTKVIYENCYLTDDEKLALCEIASEVRPDFIKTSTGFGPSSATVEDVRLMRKNTASCVKVKAAGGVRDLSSCMAMLEAGAERIGCSNSAVIADEFAAENQKR